MSKSSAASPRRARSTCASSPAAPRTGSAAATAPSTATTTLPAASSRTTSPASRWRPSTGTRSTSMRASASSSSTRGHMRKRAAATTRSPDRPPPAVARAPDLRPLAVFPPWHVKEGTDIVSVSVSSATNSSAQLRPCSYSSARAARSSAHCTLAQPGQSSCVTVRRSAALKTVSQTATTVRARRAE